MGRLLKHLRLVAVNGKRVGDPPVTDEQAKRARWLAEARRRNEAKKKNR